MSQLQHRLINGSTTANTSGGGGTESIGMARRSSSTSSAPEPFDATIPASKIASLRSHLERSLEERELPPTPFEGSKTWFGVTHERFMGLAKAWVRYLEPPGEEGFEDDTWS